MILLKKRNLLQLIAFAVMLVVVLLLVTVSVPPYVRLGAVPTLMQLPSETAVALVQVAAVPTESVPVLSATEAVSTRSSPLLPTTAASNVTTAQPKTVSVVAALPATLTVTVLPLVPRETTTLPTALPFPTLLPLINSVNDNVNQLPPAATVPHQVVITFNSASSQQERDAYVASFGGDIQQTIGALNCYLHDVEKT